jgi:hypothetical protein
VKDSNQQEKSNQYRGPDRLTFTIGTEGEIDIAVYAALDNTYAKIFANAAEELRSDPDNLQISVRAILFGCFWIEAICNRVLEEVLKKYLPASAFPVLWKILARRPILEKFSILSSFRDSSTIIEATKVASSLSKAFHFRNKLVHFQDEELVVAQQRPPDDLDALLANGLADHPFVADIRTSASKIVESIQPSVDWLEGISASLSPSRKETPPDNSQWKDAV